MCVIYINQHFVLLSRMLINFKNRLFCFLAFYNIDPRMLLLNLDVVNNVLNGVTLNEMNFVRIISLHTSNMLTTRRNSIVHGLVYVHYVKLVGKLIRIQHGAVPWCTDDTLYDLALNGLIDHDFDPPMEEVFPFHKIGATALIFAYLYFFLA